MSDKKPIDPVLLLDNIYATTFDHGILTFDLDGTVTSANVGIERITGFLYEEMVGMKTDIIFTPEDRAKNEPRREMLTAEATGRAEDYRWHLRKDGSRFWAEGVLTQLMDASGRKVGYLKIFRDITDRKNSEAEMFRLANTDRLTGAANRYAFERHAKEKIAIAMRGSQAMVLHLIDLDRFKQINDHLGHLAGDFVLQQAVQRMQGVLRKSDFLARLGGDEFVVLQSGMESIKSGADLATRLIETLTQPLFFDGHEVQIGASVGIAVCPQDSDNLDQLLKKADLALYRAKGDGKGRYHYFTDEIDVLVHQTMHELTAVRLAVEHKQFWLAYQPRMASETGQPVAVEALLRCTNPSLMGFTTIHIINLVRAAGLINALTLWVLREACLQLNKWKSQGMNALRICVNLCLEDLQNPETPDHIDALLREAGLQGTDLEIDISEPQALEVQNHGADVLHALRSRGIKIHLDSFGSGDAALSSMQNLPVTTIKLDKRFLEGVPHRRQACAVLKALIDLSKALELEVVAEYVETPEQASFLAQHHCDSLQGHALCVPVRADAMTAWLLANTEAKRH